MSYDQAVFTEHAAYRLKRREIDEALVMLVLANPDSDQLFRPGRRVLQKRVTWGMPPREYLLRVFVDVDRDVPEVVTVYVTSKLSKYEAVP